MNQISIINSVCEVLRATGTELVLVDEIHNLPLNARYGAETAERLKYLFERIPAGFVYADIDVES